MHLTLLAAGTRGDTQPYVALAVGLQRSGYSVRFAGNRNFEPLARQHGLDFFPINVDFFEMANSGQMQEMLSSENPIKFAINSFRTIGPALEQMQEAAWRACEGTQAVIFHPLTLPNGYFIARHLGLPCFPALLYPVDPTRAHPALPFYYGPRLGGAYNRLTHALTDQIIWQLFRAPVAKFWRKKFGRLPQPFGNLFHLQRKTRTPVLYGYSQHTFPRPADWPDNLHVTGYWFLDPPPDWTPPFALTHFLESGLPPIYVGFGSMGSRRAARETTEIVIKSLSLSGQRGVLLSGWSGLGQEMNLPGDIFVVEDVPHAWLFPRMKAVVHHGGMGTTAAGLRAGTPSIVVPHTGDQPIWGRFVHELGVGAKPIPRKRLTAERLAEAIKQAATDSAMSGRAAALGEKIHAEDGVARAVEVIHRYL